MSIIKNPHNPAGGGRSDDALDGLLRAFFHAELPNPWPELKPPAKPSSPARPAHRGWSLRASRWALAASVGLLLVGQLVLSGRFTDYASPPNEGEFQPATAHPNPIKIRSYKVEVEETVGPDGKVVPKVKSLTIRAERGQ
jgi:hypothetical protein